MPLTGVHDPNVKEHLTHDDPYAQDDFNTLRIKLEENYISKPTSPHTQFAYKLVLFLHGEGLLKRVNLNSEEFRNVATVYETCDPNIQERLTNLQGLKTAHDLFAFQRLFRLQCHDWGLLGDGDYTVHSGRRCIQSKHVHESLGGHSTLFTALVAPSNITAGCLSRLHFSPILPRNMVGTLL